MSEVTGSVWRAEYGEISESAQFRVGYVGQSNYEAYFPIRQLADLYSVLDGIPSAAVNVRVLGSELQAVRLVADGKAVVRVEPRLDTFPPQIMRFDYLTLADLLSVLSALQAQIGSATPSDWDESKLRPIPVDLLPPGVSPDDVKAEVNGALGFNGFQDFYGKMRQQQQTVNMTIFGSSSTDPDNTVQAWVTGFPEKLGGLFPTHTVIVHYWDKTTGNSWRTPAVTVQTGAGYRPDLLAPPELHVWIAGIGGSNWAYFLDESRRSTLWSVPDPDVIIISLGNNDGVGLAEASVRARNAVMIEWGRTYAPKAQVTLTSLAPRLVNPGRAERNNDTARQLCRERGYGYVNITQTFYDDGRSLVPGAPGGLLAADSAHPSALGAQLWRDTVFAQVEAAPSAPVLPTNPPSLTATGRLLGHLHSPGWSLRNMTESYDFLIKDREEVSLRLTKTADNAVADRSFSLNINEVKGRAVTVVASIRLPASASGFLGQLRLVVNGSTLLTSSVVETYRDQFFLISLTGVVPADATSAVVRLNINQTANTDTPYMNVGRLHIFLGNTPYDAVEPALAIPPDTTTGTLAEFDSHDLTVGTGITSWPQKAGSVPELALNNVSATTSRRPDAVTDGAEGTVLRLVAANQQYIRTQPDLVSPPGNPITIAYRVCADTLTSAFLSSTASGVNLNTDITATGAVRIGGGSATGQVSAAGAITAGVYYNITSVYDGSTSSVYVNGVLLASGTTDPGTLIRITLGANTSIGAAFFNGKFRRLKFFSRALRPVDVAALHTQWS